MTGASAQGPRLANELDAALDIIRQRAERGTERGAWIMRDLAAWLAADRTHPAAPASQSREDACRSRRATGPQVVIDDLTSPPTSRRTSPTMATVIEWPLPDRDEIAARLDASIAGPARRGARRRRRRRTARATPRSTRPSGSPPRRRRPPTPARWCSRDAHRPRHGGEREAARHRQGARARVVRPAAWRPRCRRRSRQAQGLAVAAPSRLQRERGLRSARTEGRAAGRPSRLRQVAHGQGDRHRLGRAAAAAGLGALKSKFVGESEANLRRLSR